MKKVLLLGDSIRMGYDAIVQDLLKDECEVYFSKDNGRFTVYTLEQAIQMYKVVLKSAHHAILSQNHYKFIDACSPRYTVIHNLRENGVFARVTLYSLENINKLSPDSIYLTGRDGAIKLTLDGTHSGINIWTEYDRTQVIK